jgi:hypothetical protein
VIHRVEIDGVPAAVEVSRVGHRVWVDVTSAVNQGRVKIPPTVAWALGLDLLMRSAADPEQFESLKKAMADWLSAQDPKTVLVDDPTPGHGVRRG